MRKVSSLVPVAVFLLGCGKGLLAEEGPEEAASEVLGARTVACSSCRMAASEGEVICRGCGMRLPSSSEEGRKGARPGTFPPFKPVSFSPLPKSSGPTPPELLDAAERWIEAHPDETDEAIMRLKEIRPKFKGTALEDRLDARLKALGESRRREVEALSPQQRETAAALATTRVMSEIRRQPGKVRENVAKLEELLVRVRGTSYEDYVGKKLEREQAKLSE